MKAQTSPRLTTSVERALAAATLEGQVGSALKGMGLSLKVTYLTRPDGEVVGAHWMVEKDGRRLVNYWPGKGTYWAPGSNEKGSIPAPESLVALAARLAGGDGMVLSLQGKDAATAGDEGVIPGAVRSVYCDGGVIGPNPSPTGGTWAYCHVGAGNETLHGDSGVVTPRDIGLPTVTNNFTELYAAVKAMESLPAGWSGAVYTDSKVTVCRIKNGAPKFNGIPANVVNMVWAVRRRLGTYKVVLLAGHPTRDDLFRGKKRSGLPVSKFNVWCDERCKLEARRFLQQGERH